MDGGPSAERTGPEHGSSHWPVPGETEQCSDGGEQQAGSHAGLGQGGGTRVPGEEPGGGVSQACLHLTVPGSVPAPVCTPNPGSSSSGQILHLRHQVNLRDDLLQLYSDSDEEEEEEEEGDALTL